jgi:hypothetical protein
LCLWLPPPTLKVIDEKRGRNGKIDVPIPKWL